MNCTVHFLMNCMLKKVFQLVGIGCGLINFSQRISLGVVKKCIGKGETNENRQI